MTPRKRPTVGEIRDLELALEVARRGAAHERAQRAEAYQQLSAKQDELDAEREKWRQFDGEAKALGALVQPLNEFTATLRDGRWGIGEAEQRELDEEVAASVERLLVAVGARFGARLIAARIVEAPR